MYEKRYMPISEFARLSGFNRKTLIYYDEIELFSPSVVKDNGYRFYAYSQLDTAFLIWSLREIGMSIEEIRGYIKERTPEKMVELFRRQKQNINKEIKKLAQIKTMIESHIRITEKAVKIDANTIEIKNCGAERLFMGEEIDYGDGKTVTDALADFYLYSQEKGFACTYPYGAYINREAMLRGEWKRVNRFYYVMKKGMFLKPEGTYVIGYANGDYDNTEPLHERISQYIAENGLVISGGSYKEFLLNELSIKNPDNYLMKIAVQIEPV